jgi:hypothetical protein
LTIYDVVGRLVSNVVNGKQEPGVYHPKLNITGLSQGVYFVRLNVEDESLVKKVVFVK